MPASHDPELTVERHGLRFVACPVDGGDAVIEVIRVGDGRPVDRYVLAGPVTAGPVEGSVNRWVADRLGANVPPAVPCRACDTPLEPALDRDTTYQFAGSLWVSFAGGYGMFIDAGLDGQAAARAVLCERCAAQLCAAVPWIAELLAPFGATVPAGGAGPAGGGERCADGGD